jgi:myo-inositol-1(or 4)-monophosphatase
MGYPPAPPVAKGPGVHSFESSPILSSSPALSVMIAAARKAARGLQRDFGELASLQVSQTGSGKYVETADKRCAKVLSDELQKARPTYSLLMEDAEPVKGADPEHRFLVDPVSGTFNLLRSIPHFAISIALERKGELLAAVIYNPIADELFHAEKGQGAFLNNKRMRVGARKELAYSVLACAMPARTGEGQVEARNEIAKLQGKALGLRSFGSRALTLAWVATGRFDGYWERNMKPWDMAAGLLLIREAGGFVADCDGDADPMKTGALATANADLLPLIRAELLAARRS